MTAGEQAAGPPTGADIVKQLRALQIEHADRPPGERRRLLLSALESWVGKASDEDAQEALDEVRRLLGRELRRGRGAPDDRLRMENEALRGERDRLREELSRKTAEIVRLGQDNARLQGEVRSYQSADGGAADRFERIREGMRGAVRGDAVTPESAGLPRPQTRLFRLMIEILRFVADLDMTRLTILRGLEAGAGTTFDRWRKTLLRNQLLDVLDEKEGSLKALAKTLREHRVFPIGLVTGYDNACTQGTRAILAELDPEAILRPFKGRLMTEWEKAWKAFERRHWDLSQLVELEIRERYFRQPFLKAYSEVTTVSED